MRRMYSEQELTKIIGEVFDAKIEAGAFDDSISDAVDAYLAEHPVDITALEGKTISPAVVNATTSVNSPSGSITELSCNSLSTSEREISAQKPVVEVMTGYSAYIVGEMDSWDKSISYVGVCKNGNKLTFVLCMKIKRLSTTTILSPDVVRFTLPHSVALKLIPIEIAGYSYLDQKLVPAYYSASQYVNCPMRISKATDQVTMVGAFNDLVVDTEYVIRYEATFLLSESLIS